MTVTLTDAERRAILRALSEILDGNARDRDELRRQGYDAALVKALVSVEAKLSK